MSFRLTSGHLGRVEQCLSETAPVRKTANREEESTLEPTRFLRKIWLGLSISRDSASEPAGLSLRFACQSDCRPAMLNARSFSGWSSACYACESRSEERLAPAAKLIGIFHSRVVMLQAANRY